MTSPWSETRAERHLRSLELFGMRFGLDRMRRMMTVLGAPQLAFHSVHVVGTNGKSSTTRMVAAILQRHGLRTGCYLSPHLLHYRERVQVAERDLETYEFAGAVARAAWAAERVNRTLAKDDHVTQFELLTAAAFWAMAQKGVEVAVVEAGLGGRYDATSVIESSVSALTNVGLEHTRWLGPTIADIASEKLAVLREGSALVLGGGTNGEVIALAREVAAQRKAELKLAPAAPSQQVKLRAEGAFQQENFALAETVAERFLASIGVGMRPQAVREAALATFVAGRLQVVEQDPLVVLDSAHNPHAAKALAASLQALLGDRQLGGRPLGDCSLEGRPLGDRPLGDHLLGDRPLGLVLGVLEDKDAAGMLRSLLPLAQRAWFTAPPSARALSPSALLSLARQLGFERSDCEPQPQAALAAAIAWAGERKRAAVLATGSVYLVGALLAGDGRRARAAGKDGDRCLRAAGEHGDRSLREGGLR
jgi:dihydrofolate synthase/folylpolyglutamate synthase